MGEGLFSTDLMEKFDCILNNKEYCLAYKEFLKRVACEENLIFWFEVELFRKELAMVPLAQKDRIVQRAKYLYAKYCCNGSSHQLNVDDEPKKQILKSLENNDANTDIFDTLQHEVYRLMLFDSFQKFIETEEYSAILLREKRKKRRSFIWKLLNAATTPNKNSKPAQNAGKSRALSRATSVRTPDFHSNTTCPESFGWQPGMYEKETTTKRNTTRRKSFAFFGSTTPRSADVLEHTDSGLILSSYFSK